jgi:hypothetical protein
MTTPQSASNGLDTWTSYTAYNGGGSTSNATLSCTADGGVDG